MIIQLKTFSIKNFFFHFQRWKKCAEILKTFLTFDRCWKAYSHIFDKCVISGISLIFWNEKKFGKSFFFLTCRSKAYLPPPFGNWKTFIEITFHDNHGSSLLKNLIFLISHFSQSRNILLYPFEFPFTQESSSQLKNVTKLKGSLNWKILNFKYSTMRGLIFFGLYGFKIALKPSVENKGS